LPPDENIKNWMLKANTKFNKVRRMKNNLPLLKRISGNRLFWLLVVLALILIFDAIFIPGFFKIGILEGHLYGNPIDVLNNAVPLMLLAIGMTLVIATGGVDLSVGAVIAISAAMARNLIYPASIFFLRAVFR
jgi:ribose/xylose/arabinose/galactoside ABC-type transport system permease subunit